MSENGRSFRVAHKARVIVPDGLLDAPQNQDVYIDNLLRLQIIEIPSTHYSRAELYAPLENLALYADIDEEIAFLRKIIKISPFGKLFVKICITEEKI